MGPMRLCARLAHQIVIGLPPRSLDVAHARKVVDAVLHPDTGEKIALPLRLSAIVPMNLCLDTGMILARGTWQIVAAQWTNQSYNATGGARGREE